MPTPSHNTVYAVRLRPPKLPSATSQTHKTLYAIAKIRRLFVFIHPHLFRSQEEKMIERKNEEI